MEKRRKGEGRGERECLGSTATAAAACQDKRRKKKKTAGLTERKDFFLAVLEKEKRTGGDDGCLLTHGDAFLYDLQRRVHLEIEKDKKEI